MSALEAAWQAALAAEHQAVFGYGLLGPYAGGDEPLAVEYSGAHERLRDATVAALLRAGLTPVAPQADYPALYPVPDATTARRVALRLEEQCAQAWRFVYLRAASGPSPRAAELRTTAQANLTASAVRATQWRRRVSPQHPTTAFPGI